MAAVKAELRPRTPGRDPPFEQMPHGDQIFGGGGRAHGAGSLFHPIFDVIGGDVLDEFCSKAAGVDKMLKAIGLAVAFAVTTGACRSSRR
jgi:hypothetical protein